MFLFDDDIDVGKKESNWIHFHQDPNLITPHKKILKKITDSIIQKGWNEGYFFDKITRNLNRLNNEDSTYDVTFIKTNKIGAAANLKEFLPEYLGSLVIDEKCSKKYWCPNNLTASERIYEYLNSINQVTNFSNAYDPGSGTISDISPNGKTYLNPKIFRQNTLQFCSWARCHSNGTVDIDNGNFIGLYYTPRNDSEQIRCYNPDNTENVFKNDAISAQPTFFCGKLAKGLSVNEIYVLIDSIEKIIDGLTSRTPISTIVKEKITQTASGTVWFSDGSTINDSRTNRLLPNYTII